MTKFITNEYTLTCNFVCFRFYTIVAPKSIRPYSEYHVSLTGYELTEPINIRLTINGSTYSDEPAFLQSKDVFLESNSAKTVQFDVSRV